MRAFAAISVIITVSSLMFDNAQSNDASLFRQIRAGRADYFFAGVAAAAREAGIHYSTVSKFIKGEDTTWLSVHTLTGWLGLVVCPWKARL